MLEKTSPEFGEQDARDGIIQPGSGQFAGINQCPDIAFVKSSDHLHVNPSSESPQSCGHHGSHARFRGGAKRGQDHVVERVVGPLGGVVIASAFSAAVTGKMFGASKE